MELAHEFRVSLNLERGEPPLPVRTMTPEELHQRPFNSFTNGRQPLFESEDHALRAGFRMMFRDS